MPLRTTRIPENLHRYASSADYHQRSTKYRCLVASLACVLPLLVLSGGCTASPQYNSLDLALLPCESGDSPVFFQAIEFDHRGVPQHAQQVESLRERFEEGRPVNDLVVFVHGWNKNPSSAELDYQNFLCRLHGRLRTVASAADRKRAGGLVMLGVFWPSTITNKPKEPIWLKPISYFQVRKRADTVAEVGLAKLLVQLKPGMERSKLSVPIRVHLIGHSFGGRMVIRSLETLQGQGQLVPFLITAESVNVILVNAAVPSARFDWIEAAVVRAGFQKTPARFTESTASYLFNLHSFNDTPNKVLFPIASVFNDDQFGCAAGACGVPSYETLCVDASGKLKLELGESLEQRDLSDRFNAWNVDVTQIVFDHSDIYKGRVATLIADLLYSPVVRKNLPGESPAADADSDARCNAEAQH